MDPSIFNNPQSPDEENDAALAARYSAEAEGKSRHYKTEEATDPNESQSQNVLGSIQGVRIEAQSERGLEAA